ncbi:MAG: DMT family transporter [Bradymonadia bacterium]
MHPAIVTLGLTVITIVAFAGNSLITRAALADGHLGPEAFVVVRLGSGALVLAIIGGIKGAYIRPRRADIAGVISLFTYAAGFTFAYVSMGAALGALILFACVQFTMSGVSALKGQRPSHRELLGLTVALGGLVALLTPGLKLEGAIWPVCGMALAGVAWGVYSVLGKGVTDPVARTARNFIGAAVLAAPLGIFIGEVSTTGLLLGVLSGAVTSGLGYVIWYATVPRLSMATAGVAQLLVPAVAAVGGVIWLGEHLTTLQWVSVGVILTGIGVTVTQKRTRKTPSPALRTDDQSRAATSPDHR